MQCFHTEGSPRERGLSHGRQAGEEIARLVAHYRRSFLAGDGSWRKGWSPEERRSRVMRRVEQIRKVYGEGCEEIEGIAEGARLPVEDVFELNLGFEFGRAPACSVIGLHDETGRVWLAKSDDVAEAELGANAVQHSVPSTGVRSVQMQFVGTIWTTSFVSESGFCFGMTGLTGRIQNPDGIPTLFLLHLLAERCRTVADAEAVCASFEVSQGGMSILVGDASGDLAILEKHAVGQSIRRPEGVRQAIWQTNHCCGVNLIGQDDPSSALLGNSRDRMALLEERKGNLDRSFEGLARLYRTHGSPAGICQHGEAGLHTDSAILMCPEACAMWITQGYPCRHPFIRHPADPDLEAAP